jgi:hypothetical protein
MSAATNAFENMLIDGHFRGGCLTTSGSAGSAAVVKALWSASTAYALGEVVVPHPSMTGAGGKLLQCTTAGTTGTTNTLAVPHPGSTLVDATVTWTAIATLPSLPTHYVALFTVMAGEGGGGTEVSGGSYARVAYAATLANWAGTHAGGSTTSSTGTGGTTSNNAPITFPIPTADWGTIAVPVVAWGLFDRASGGTLLVSAPLTTPRVILSGDAAPYFAAGDLTLTVA